MPKFIYAYHGGKAPESPEETEKVMAAWKNWFDSMGQAVLDGGGPTGDSKTVVNGRVDDNGGANPISGYSLIAADNHDTAVAMAKGCPMVVDGSGSIEVCEVHEM